MGKRGPEKQYNDRLDIVLPGKLKLKLFSAAKRQSKTVSQYVRELVDQALGKAE
jgi:predicted DNA-binding protein